MAEAVIGSIKKPNKEETIYDPEYRHSIVSSRYVSHTSFLANVDGIPIMTEYYRQVRGKDEEPIGFQPESPETYQSYTRIKGLIIKQDGNRSFNLDPQKGISNDRGLGYVIFDLVPIKGDVFIKDNGSGRAGLYQLTEAVEYKTNEADKVYQIEYQLIAFMNQEIEDNLNAKVVKELVYSRESALNGSDAVLTVGDYDANKTINNLMTLISEHILRTFWFKRDRTIVLPTENDTDAIIYDPYLTHFLSVTIPSSRVGTVKNITVLSVDYGQVNRGQKPLTVWDMFFQRMFDYPQQFKREYWKHSKYSLINTRYYGNVYFSDVDEVLLTSEFGSSSEAYRYSFGILGDEEGLRPQNGVQAEPYEYFFSNEFYEGKGTETEQFVWKFFKEKTIDKQALVKILEKYWDLTPMEQLYMGGIYVAACRIALSTTYHYL